MSVNPFIRPPARPLGRRMRVAYDKDEVLVLQNEPVLPYFLESKWGRGKLLTIEHYTHTRLHDLWGVSEQDAFDITCEIITEHALEFPVVEHAQETIGRLRQSVDLFVVTSVSTLLEAITLAQVELNFPGMFQHVELTGGIAANIPPIPKWKICKQYGYDVMVDDNGSTTTSCADHGIYAFLFGDYGWNRDVRLSHPKALRTLDHLEVEAQINRLRVELGAD